MCQLATELMVSFFLHGKMLIQSVSESETELGRNRRMEWGRAFLSLLARYQSLSRDRIAVLLAYESFPVSESADIGHYAINVSKIRSPIEANLSGK